MLKLSLFLLPLLCAGQVIVTPRTGEATVPGNSAQDGKWTVDSHLSGEPGNGAAAIVTKLGAGWLTPDPGTAWIAPQPDQSNATRTASCCQGGVLYKYTFNVQDTSTVSLQFKVAADKDITIWLNDMENSSIIYSADGSTAGKAISLSMKQGTVYILPDGLRNTIQFVPGTNTLTVEVDNYQGGPTGFYIGSPSTDSPRPSSYSDGGFGDFAITALRDPVDSATGQFYDNEVDFHLGGPMALGFERWYSSQLAKTGVVSALGTNWMGTYDMAALVNGAKAQVLLFGGRVVTFTNAAGAWQLQSPLSTAYQFATANGGYQFLDPATQWIYTFNTAGVMTKIEDRNGNALTVTPGSNGPAKVADGLGRTLTFSYTGGQLSSVQDQSGRTTTYTYSNGVLSAVTDPLKAVTNYSYTGKGLLTKETLPLGNAPLTQSYDASGRVLTQTGTSNNVSKLGFDGLTTTITDPNGNLTKQRNDDAGNLLQTTDALGNTANTSYDASHRPIAVTDRAGGTRRYVFDSRSGTVTAVTDENGNTTTYAFQPQTRGGFTFYDLVGVTYPDGNTTTLVRDSNGNVTGGPQLTVSYDSRGRATNLGSSTLTYNSDSTVAAVQDGAGNTTRFDYDSLKRVAKVTDPSSRARIYTYDGDGRRTNFFLAGQDPWQLHYNSNGQVDTVTNPAGGVFALTYNAAGLVATETDPIKNVTTFAYDNLNQINKVQTAAYTRDALGRITEAPGHRYGYDPEDRLLSETNGLNRTTNYTYTKGGQLATVLTPANNLWSFAYDWRGNLVSGSNPLGDTFQHSFDALGRLTGITDAGGFATALQRDAAGKPTSFTSANGNTWTFTYDPSERVSTVADPAGNTTSYTYKGADLSKIDFPVGSVSYSYDARGNRTLAQYSDGTAVHTTYDAMRLITSADNLTIERDKLGQPSKVNGIAILRDGEGKPLTLTYAPGKAITYSYDKSGRVDSIADWTGGKTSFTYDDASRRLTQTFPNGVTTTFGYDDEGNRNTIDFGALGSIALTRDATGKILSADRNLPLSPTVRDDGGIQTASTDALGRVTAQGARSYTWNLASQLTAFADPVNSGAMTYDGLGELNTSTASGTAQSYVFNYALDFPALSITRQAGADQRYYVYMPDGELLYSIDADNSRRFFHFDEMGNTVFLTDAAGSVTDSYAITPYGEIADHVGTTANPFTWQGQYGAIQQADGLYYLRSRYYDASTARFLSPDPFMDAEPQASEPYNYARANPMLFVDPWGTSACDWWIISAFCKAVETIFHSTPAPVVQPVARPVVRVIPKVVKTTPALKVPAQPVEQYVPPAVRPPARIISQDGNSIISQDGNSIISQDGNSIISQDGNSIISQDGNSIVSDFGNALISQDGNRLVSSNGVVSRSNSSVISNDGGTFRPRVNAYRIQNVNPPKAKNNKR